MLDINVIHAAPSTKNLDKSSDSEMHTLGNHRTSDANDASMVSRVVYLINSITVFAFSRCMASCRISTTR